MKIKEIHNFNIYNVGLLTVTILTSDGSNIGDWWKMESKHSYSTEFGEGKIHYYQTKC